MNGMSPPLTDHRAPRGALLALAVLVGASAGCGKSSVAPVIPPLSRVTLDPPLDTLRIGDVASFVATAYDMLGNAVSGVSFGWVSGNPGVFRVDRLGRVFGVGEGTASLFVTAGGRSDTALVTVFPDTGWFVQPSSANGADLFGVSFRPDGATGWAVGEGGTILKTANAGASWEMQASHTAFNLHSVWFTSDLEGWAVGAGGTVLTTRNGGTLWTRLSNVNAGEVLMDVTFAARDTGWVVGSNGTILRTFDRGAHWSETRLATAFTLNGVAFAGTRDGWVVGDGGVIGGTHDRGLTWFVVPSLTSQPIKEVRRRSEAQAYAAGSQGVVPRTVSSPDSTAWQLRNAGSNFQLEGVSYPTDLIGYAVGADAALGGTVLRTDDGGNTWEVQAAHTGTRLNDVFFVDALHGWAVGQGGAIVHTARGGRR